MRQPLSHWAWIAALSCHVLLMAGLWRWAGVLPGLLLVLPLAAALPGLVRRRTYTAGWMTLLLVLYMAALLSEGFSFPARRQIALSLSTVAMFEFISLVLFVRWSARERAPA